MLRFISIVFYILSFLVVGSACNGSINLPDGQDTTQGNDNSYNLDDDIKADGHNGSKLTLSFPSEATVGVPAAFSGTAPSSIEQVVVLVDGWKIADEMVSNGQYSFDYTFDTQGQNRLVRALGYDSESKFVDEVSGYLDVLNAEMEFTLSLPSEATVGVPAAFSGTAPSSIKRVVVSIDGWEIADKVVSGGQYSFNYTFDTAGHNRLVQAVGYDSGSNFVDEVSGYLDVLNAEMEFTLSLPSEATVGVPAAFSGTAPSSIKRVVVSIDGWEIADEMVSGGQYSFDYTFNTPGQNRLVQAVGYDSGSQFVDEVTGYLDVVNAGSFISGVPYFYQYHNSINPGGSCQNTSMAMILKFYGATSVTPDSISNYYGTSQAQTVAGFQGVFNSEAAYYGLSWRDAGTTNGTLGDIHSQLAAGIPVVVHGYFTSYGHVIVLVGYDGDVYWAHDPAGKWNEVYKGGGYSGYNSTEGKYVTYSAAAVNAAIAPDGVVWMHSFYQL